MKSPLFIRLNSLKLYLTIMLILLVDPCFAASSDTQGIMPYEGWLYTLSSSLAGPAAFYISLIGIVAAGFSLILSTGEITKFVKAIVFIIFTMSLILGANTLLTSLFNGASI